MLLYTGRASGARIGLGSIAVLLFMLWSVGCGTLSADNAPVVATGTSRPAAIAPPPTRPPATATAPLPTFPLHADTAAAQPPMSDATPTLEPKAALHVFTDWALGPSVSQTSRVKAIAYSRYRPGDVVFEWWLYDYPSVDSLRGGARLDACTILMGIVHGRVDYTSAVLHGYLTPQHVLGHSAEGLLVVSLTYSRSTAESIDFNDSQYLCTDKIYDLADRSSIASDFR